VTWAVVADKEGEGVSGIQVNSVPKSNETTKKEKSQSNKENYIYTGFFFVGSE
jgi:hypothetical protein